MSNSGALTLTIYNDNINIHEIENIYMYLVQNRVCKHGNEFYCYLCKSKEDNFLKVLIHLSQDKEHQIRNKISEIQISALENLKINEIKSVEIVFSGIIVLSAQELYCTICLCTIPSINHVANHIEGRRHSLKDIGKVVDTFNTSESNSIVENTNEYNAENEDIASEVNPIFVYYCRTCKICLKCNTTVKYHNMFHVSQLNNYTSKDWDIISFSLEEQNTKCIHCTICDYKMYDEKELEDHLQDIIHNKRLVVLKRQKNMDLIHNALCILSINTSNINNYSSNVNNYSSNVDECKYIYKTFYCEICDMTIPYNSAQLTLIEHNRGKKHKHLESLSVPKKDLQFKLDAENCVPIYKCFICDMEFNTENLLVAHYNSEAHSHCIKAINFVLQEKNISIVSVNENLVLHCLLCKVNADDLLSILNHISGSKHKKKEKMLHATISIEDNINIYSFGSNDPPIVNLDNVKTNSAKLAENDDSSNDSHYKINHPYFCPICEINVKNDFMLTSHLKSKNHKKKKVYYMDYNEIKEINFLCPICDDIFCNDILLLEHIEGVKHKNMQLKLQNFEKNSFEILDIEDSSLNFQALSDNEFDSVVNELIDIDIDTAHNKKSTSLSKNEEQGKYNNVSSKYFKRLSTFGKKYITMCIEPGDDNIFNAIYKKIKKMELYTNLTCPYNFGRTCIPCKENISEEPQLMYDHFQNGKHIKNFLTLEENHRLFENLEDHHLSDLELGRSHMQENSDELIKCFACNTFHFYDSIQSHIQTEKHITNSVSFNKSGKEIFKKIKNILNKTWYFTDKFVCQICCTIFDSEIRFAEHLTQLKHLQKVNDAVKNHEILQFNMCFICATYWYGKTNGYDDHCNGVFHKYLLETQNYVIPNLPSQTQDILDCYENTIDSLLHQSDNIDKDVENQLLDSVKTVIKTHYPKVKIYLYGSRLSCTGSCNSDLDIYVDCKNISKSNEENQEQLLGIQKCFQEHESTWIIEDVLLTAKIPIIKVRHRSTNQYCDISCFDGLGIKKSKLIRYFVKTYPICQKLIIYLKKWMFLCGLSGAQGINSFATSLFVIFFLQIQKVLPSICQIASVDLDADNQKEIIVQNTNYSDRDLLKDFFFYYNDFDYRTNIISPFLGKMLKKEAFANLDNLPTEMNVYKELYNMNQVDLFRFDSPLCVQDPVDLSQNVTKAVTKLQIRTFQKYCLESVKILFMAEK